MALERFHFTSDDGSVTIELPKYDQVKGIAGIIRAHRHNDEELPWAVLEAAGDKKTLLAFDKLSLNDIARFFTEWAASASATPGE